MQAGIIDFAVYEDATEYLGIASVDLPDVSSKTITVNGAGIAGDITLPVLGHTEAMTVKFSFTDNPRAVGRLAEQRVHTLTLMAAHEEFDPVENRLKVKSYKHILKVMPNTTAGGSLAPASAQGVSIDCACIYRQDFVDGEQTLLIDKVNNIFIDGTGTDILAEVRNALGKPVTSQI